MGLPNTNSGMEYFKNLKPFFLFIMLCFEIIGQQSTRTIHYSKIFFICFFIFLFFNIKNFCYSAGI